MSLVAGKRDALLTGLDLLRALHRDVLTAEQLSERAGRDRWHVRKVMEALTAAGWTERMEGRPIRYRLHPARRLPVPALTGRDRRAVALLRALASFCAPYEDVAGVRDLLRKLAVLVDQQAFRRDDPLVKLLTWKPHPDGEVPKLNRFLNAVATAVEGGWCLELRYRARKDKDARERLVSPQRLLRWNHLMYLVAWDHRRQALRSFALTRCQGVRVSRRRRCARPDEEVERYIHGPFGVFQADEGQRRSGTQRVVIDFDEEVSRYAEEVRWHPSQELLKEGRGVRLMMDVPVTPDLVGWILSFRGHARPLHPPSLAKEVLEAALAIAGTFVKSTTDPELLLTIEKAAGRLFNGCDRAIQRVERLIDEWDQEEAPAEE